MAKNVTDNHTSMPKSLADAVHNIKQDRATKAARDLSNAVNEMSFDVEAFAQALRREHPCLQQNTMRAVVELLKQWAADADSGNYDQRNEDTVKLARDLLAGVDNTNLSHI
jgi:outer membrane murein-binding lipoprotein Lpp